MFCTNCFAFNSISAKTSGLAIPPEGLVGGASSKIFWKRRWVEQSRPFSATALPCSSPTTWTSKCLAPVMSCMTKMGEPGCSFSTCGNAALNSSAFLHMRMPLPPPPSDALSMTGYWTRSAAARASSAEWTQPASNVSLGMVPSSCRFACKGPSSPGLPKDPLQGMEGTFAVCARIFAAILSPSTLMTGAGGPMKAMPFSLRALGSFGFSEAWPQPGQTASTPNLDAVSTMSLTFA
mmetsp:Transcript_25830/g.66981  ORF Transcript_25830/g.66981 Transcript_25830/m.66981 type:complete len:236 (-) Transcript_25830:565-1272(-)